MFPTGLGSMEMMMVGIIALLLFGKRLPEVMRNLGKGVMEFKKGMQGIENEFRAAMHETESSSKPAVRPVPPPAAERSLPALPKFEPPAMPPS